MTEWGLFRLNPKLFRIETEALELLAPFGGQIAETLDADAAGRRPSMAALTRLGARNASEMVMLT